MSKNFLQFEEFTNNLLAFINRKLPTSNFIKKVDDSSINNEHACTVDLNDQGEYWWLGYSNVSITPPDISEKDYYIGGNISASPRKIKSVIDDIKVRTICISVNPNNEKIILSSVDCIGLTSFYVNIIRRKLLDYSKKHNIKSINVFSTHTHSSIDTMGIWSVSVKKFVSSCKDLKNNNTPLPAVDTDYMDFLVQKIEESICEAVENIKPGKMYMLKIGENSADKIREDFYNKIGFDCNSDVWNKEWERLSKAEISKKTTATLGIYEYLFAKRSPYEYSPCVTRIRFKPFNQNEKETIIVNLSAHPYSNGLKIKGEWGGDSLSGDFPYYMEKTMNENGYNFIFFNGAINGIYPKREATQIGEKTQGVPMNKQTETIGCDFASLILSIDKQRSEIFSNYTLNPIERSNVYASMIEKNDYSIKEIGIKPQIFVLKKSIYLKCSNNIEKIIGKLNFSQFEAFSTKKDEIYLNSEIGYIQMGDCLKIVLMPGEITPGLLTGKGDMIKHNTLKKNGSDFESIANVIGDETIVFGLANDAIGYIIPDHDYCMAYLGNGFLSKKIFGKNFTHYQEIFSIGNSTASEIIKNLKSLKLEIEQTFKS